MLLSNVLVTTARSYYTKTTGLTGPAINTIQQAIPGHIRPITGITYKALPEAALESDYQLKVDSGTDIREGDVLSSITLLDGETPWPEMGLANNKNEVFRVTYVVESSPLLLTQRIVYVKRERGGGPTY